MSQSMSESIEQTHQRDVVREKAKKILMDPNDVQSAEDWNKVMKMAKDIGVITNVFKLVAQNTTETATHTFIKHFFLNTENKNRFGLEGIKTCIDVLIQHEENLNEKDVEDDTVLHLLSKFKDTHELIYRFFTKEPKPTFTMNKTGNTPLHLAIIHKNLDCLNELAYYAYTQEEKLNSSSLTDKQGNTPLHLAAMLGDAKALEVLVHHVKKYPEILNACNTEGFSALDLVFTTCPGSSMQECYKTLSEAGVKLARVRGLDSSIFTFLPPPPTTVSQDLKPPRQPEDLRVSTTTPATEKPEAPATEMPEGVEMSHTSVDDLEGVNDLTFNRPK